MKAVRKNCKKTKRKLQRCNFKEGDLIKVINSPYSGIQPGMIGKIIGKKIQGGFGVNIFAVFEKFDNGVWKKKPETRIMWFKVEEIELCKS